MAKTLKMFMRGKGVRMLQQQLKQMGYPMDDVPALFGASTRDAVKEFQKRKGLEITGVADEQLQNLITESVGVSVAEKEKHKSAAPAQNNETEKRLEALTRLLINKGVISREELDQLLEQTPAASRPARVSQKPLF